MTKKRIIRISIFLLIVILVILFFVWQNNSIITTQIEIQNSKIPSEFHNYKIIQISDLHNKEFGNEQNRLLKKIKDERPDIIVVTGDLIDSNKTDIKTAMEFVAGAVNIAPTYFISGNHEIWSNDYLDLKSRLEKEKVTILEDQTVNLKINNSSIDLIGISDSSISRLGSYTEDISPDDTPLHMIEKNSYYKILLSHRPEWFTLYSKTDADLVLSGHAHGGQIRLPFIGGLIAPDQGFFPEYTSGVYEKNGTSMIVSRGLGNSVIPVRVFNRPEIIVVTLKN